jgi:hypothetical protein
MINNSVVRCYAISDAKDPIPNEDDWLLKSVKRFKQHLKLEKKGAEEGMKRGKAHARYLCPSLFCVVSLNGPLWFVSRNCKPSCSSPVLE